MKGSVLPRKKALSVERSTTGPANAEREITLQYNLRCAQVQYGMSAA